MPVQVLLEVDAICSRAIQMDDMAEPIAVPSTLPSEANFVREYDLPVEGAPQSEHHAIHEVFEDASKRARHAIEGAGRKIRLKMRTLASERPIRLIVVVAVISFVTGIGLRLWRSSYE